MKDKDFLQFIHDRIVWVYNENQNVDFLHKLRAIINSTDENIDTPNVCSSQRDKYKINEVQAFRKLRGPHFPEKQFKKMEPERIK